MGKQEKGAKSLKQANTSSNEVVKTKKAKWERRKEQKGKKFFVPDQPFFDHMYKHDVDRGIGEYQDSLYDLLSSFAILLRTCCLNESMQRTHLIISNYCLYAMHEYEILHRVAHSYPS